MSKLGIDISEWTIIKAITQKKRLKIFANNKLCYNLPYRGAIGKLKIMQIFFKGSGSIDWVRINNLKGKNLYMEEF